jgi:HPt (histidine-containing phosphotransfer) domain-containing protein
MAATPAFETAILDGEALRQLRGLGGKDNPDFFPQVCGKFLTAAEERIGRLAAAVSESDVETAEREAHSLKSIAAYVGASDLSARCLDMEAAARKGDLSLCAASLPWLREELARVERALSLETGATGQAKKPIST